MSNFEIIPGGDPAYERFLAAARLEQEYATGERQINQERVGALLEDPERGEFLESMLRENYVGFGRRKPEQQAEVDRDTNAIIASIKDPTVHLTGRLATKRDHFLQMLDGLTSLSETSADDQDDD